MGRRSRKRREPGEGAPEPALPRDDPLSRGYARGRERDEQIRAELEPLGPGERPGPVTVAAIVAVLFFIVNIVLWATCIVNNGESSESVGNIVFSGYMFISTYGK